MKLAEHTPKKEAFLKLLAGLLLAVAALAAHASAVSASALLGIVVTNPQGEKLGTIQDLAVDVKSGSIAYAIVDYRDPSAMRIDVRPVALTELRPGLAPGRLVLDPSAAGGGTTAPREHARLLRASTVLGMKIEHPTGADYGVIDDIVVDLETARVQHAVVRLDVGGREQKRDVPLEALRFPAGSNNALLTLGKLP